MGGDFSVCPYLIGKIAIHVNFVVELVSQSKLVCFVRSILV